MSGREIRQKECNGLTPSEVKELVSFCAVLLEWKWIAWSYEEGRMEHEQAASIESRDSSIRPRSEDGGAMANDQIFRRYPK